MNHHFDQMKGGFLCTCPAEFRVHTLQTAASGKVHRRKSQVIVVERFSELPVLWAKNFSGIVS
jgi:hypothetical protein